MAGWCGKTDSQLLLILPNKHPKLIVFPAAGNTLLTAFYSKQGRPVVTTTWNLPVIKSEAKTVSFSWSML